MADGPMVWSTKWQLKSVSNNLKWDSLDFVPSLGETEHGIP